MGHHARAAIGVEGFMIRERMKMMGDIGFDDFFEINIFRDNVHDSAPDMTRVPAFGWFHKTIWAEMLRFESNARAIDHDVITQSSTNNGGMDFHNSNMPSLKEKGKLSKL